MTKFPLIEAMGLKVFSFAGIEGMYVDAGNLEQVLSESPKVYGVLTPMGQVGFGLDISNMDTHSARLVCVRKINKEPLKEVKEMYVSMESCNDIDLSSFNRKRVRITIEEIGGES